MCSILSWFLKPLIFKFFTYSKYKRHCGSSDESPLFLSGKPTSKEMYENRSKNNGLYGVLYGLFSISLTQKRVTLLNLAHACSHCQVFI